MKHSHNCLLTLGIILFAFAANPAEARKKKEKPQFEPTVAQPVPLPQANGAIFQTSQGYAPLTSGQRAAMVGDVVTILLAERTTATKSNSAATGRDGSIGLAPPVAGPFSLISSADVNMSGSQSFNGSGQAAQSNALSGEISVTIAEIYPNGTMLVRGEKFLQLNRGDEKVQISGIIRSADISADNRILSTRVADAQIYYFGKGEIARASKQGWLQRFFSIISPF